MCEAESWLACARQLTQVRNDALHVCMNVDDEVAKSHKIQLPMADSLSFSQPLPSSLLETTWIDDGALCRVYSWYL